MGHEVRVRVTIGGDWKEVIYLIWSWQRVKLRCQQVKGNKSWATAVLWKWNQEKPEKDG